MSARKDFLRQLKKCQLEYIELPSEGGGAVYIVPQLGGRILGVFLKDQNLLWVHPKLSTDWNAGGQRTWFAPVGGEFGIYFSEDWNYWKVPPAMDPGNYRVMERMEGKFIGLENDFSVYSNEAYQYHLSFSRRFRVDESNNIPCDLSAFPDLKKLQLSFEHLVRNRMEQTLGNEVGLWSIVQVIPPGTIVIPVTDFSHSTFTDTYFEPIPEERIKQGKKSISVFVDGNRRYKLGFSPKVVTGRIGYISRLKRKEYYAIVKLFSVDPNGIYVDKPKENDRENGDVIQLYNHSKGQKVTFAELGCHAPAPFLAPGEEQSFPISIIFLQGKKEEVLQAVSELIGEPQLNIF
jgi:hypothetical protein